MKLLISTKSKLTKNKNGENVPTLEIPEVVLVHCNIVNNNYQQNIRVLCILVPNKSFAQNFYIFHNYLTQSFHILKYGLLIKILNR